MLPARIALLVVLAAYFRSGFWEDLVPVPAALLVVLLIVVSLFFPLNLPLAALWAAFYPVVRVIASVVAMRGGIYNYPFTLAFLPKERL